MFFKNEYTLQKQILNKRYSQVQIINNRKKLKTVWISMKPNRAHFSGKHTGWEVNYRTLNDDVVLKRQWDLLLYTQYVLRKETVGGVYDNSPTFIDSTKTREFFW